MSRIKTRLNFWVETRGKKIQSVRADWGDGQSTPPMQDWVDRLFKKTFSSGLEKSDWQWFDDSDLTDFQVQVYQELIQIKPGQVVTYKGLADKIGKPRAARAVGGAMNRNPFLCLIPCHRVIETSGGLGGFACGLEMKRYLLEKEGWDDSKIGISRA